MSAQRHDLSSYARLALKQTEKRKGLQRLETYVP